MAWNRGGFSDVDSADDPRYWLRYLADVERAPSMTQVRERTYAALGSRDGAGADVGCGRGRAVGDLTARPDSCQSLSDLIRAA